MSARLPRLAAFCGPAICISLDASKADHYVSFGVDMGVFELK